jgi:hypothetical protein
LDTKNQKFLKTVIETSTERLRVINNGTVLWRAQLGNDLYRDVITDYNGDELGSRLIPIPFSSDRMCPLSDRANEGRVNPKGIPCLYFSTEMNTAMTETRPWIGSFVSIAQFQILKNVTVVDCTKRAYGEGVYWPSPCPADAEAYIWWCINQAFSQPVTRSDDVAEYAVTQVLSEAFRKAGYDGVAYGSKLGSGITVAMFDLSVAKFINCHLYRVNQVNLEFAVESPDPDFEPIFLPTDENWVSSSAVTKPQEDQWPL